MPAPLNDIQLEILKLFEQAQSGEELKEIIAYSQWQVRTLIVITAVVVVPFVEELIFRGMIQTLLRSYIMSSPTSKSAVLAASEQEVAFGGSRPAIFLASFVFVVFSRQCAALARIVRPVSLPRPYL
jgi:membrane protease YdiL (CAAX protease family)